MYLIEDSYRWMSSENVKRALKSLLVLNLVSRSYRVFPRADKLFLRICFMIGKLFFKDVQNMEW